jgi:hypothetical protein
MHGPLNVKLASAFIMIPFDCKIIERETCRISRYYGIDKKYVQHFGREN